MKPGGPAQLRASGELEEHLLLHSAIVGRLRQSRVWPSCLCAP